MKTHISIPRLELWEFLEWMTDNNVRYNVTDEDFLTNVVSASDSKYDRFFGSTSTFKFPIEILSNEVLFRLRWGGYEYLE
jgi:hypothetical protein